MTSPARSDDPEAVQPVDRQPAGAAEDRTGDGGIGEGGSTGEDDGRDGPSAALASEVLMGARDEALCRELQPPSRLSHTGMLEMASFDPAELLGLRRWLWTVPRGFLVLQAVVVIAMLSIVNIMQGTFGGVRDIRLVDDLKRILGVAVTAPAPPRFPLIRDVASWLMVASMLIGTHLVMMMVRRMRTALSELVDRRALVSRTPVVRADGTLDSRHTYRLDWLSRLMGIDRLLRGDVAPDAALAVFLTASMSRLRRWRFIAIGVVAIAVLGTAVWLQNLGQRLVFTSFAPPQYQGAQLQSWLDTARDNWWASPSHPAGYVLLWLMAMYTVLVIVVYFLMVLTALYIVAGLRHVVSPAADWLNRDGRYGWKPLDSVYRSMLKAGGLLGATLAAAVVAVGLQSVSWVGVVLAAYVLFAPFYVIVPAVLFSKVVARIKDRRAEQLSGLLHTVDLDSIEGLSEAAIVTAEIDRVRKAPIHPLRLRTGGYAAVISVWVLPVILTIAQVLLTS